jgi:hypothetical protein
LSILRRYIRLAAAARFHFAILNTCLLHNDEMLLIAVFAVHCIEYERTGV